MTHAVTEMQKQGVPVTPGKVERAVNAARPTVSVAEATAMVKATCEQLERYATPADPFEGRRVAGVFLSPRGPDGAYATNDEVGGVVKVVRVGPKEAQRYAAPQPYFATANDRRGAPGDVGQPTAADELARKRAKLKELQAIIDAPGTSDQQRAKAWGETIKLIEDIAAAELALHPVPQAGTPPTAGR
jgi:hypothetical protein